MKELLPHESAWIYFIQNVKRKSKLQKYIHSMIPYCMKFGILKLNTLLINTYAYKWKVMQGNDTHFRTMVLLQKEKGEWHLKGYTGSIHCMCNVLFYTILSFSCKAKIIL